MASMHCLQVSPDIAALPGSGVWAVLVLVTSGHVTINSPRAAPDLEWMGAGCDLGGQLVTPKYFRAIVQTVPLTVYGSGFSATTEQSRN